MKKKIAPLVALFLAHPLLACLGIILGFAALIVGGIIVYKLYCVCEQKLGPNTASQMTNSIASQLVPPDWAIDWPTNGGVWVTSSQSRIGSREVYYGISSTGLPWVSLDPKYVAPDDTNALNGLSYSTIWDTGSPVVVATGLVKTFENDSNCLDVLYVFNNCLSHVVVQLGNNPATNTAVTGYTIDLCVQSSVDLTNWNTICEQTNVCLDVPLKFTDTFLPQDRNFYRAFYK